MCCCVKLARVRPVTKHLNNLSGYLAPLSRGLALVRGPARGVPLAARASTGGLGRSVESMVESKSRRRGDKELLLQSQQPSADGLRVRPSAMTDCCCACHNPVMFPEYSPSAFGRLQLRGGYRLKVTLFQTCYFEACNLRWTLPQSKVQTRLGQTASKSGSDQTQTPDDERAHEAGPCCGAPAQ